MKETRAKKYISIKKLPSFLLKIFVLMIAAAAIIISANNIMEYINVKEQNDVLKSKYENKNLRIDELKYYINTDIDDEYRERMARVMGYCFPDETIYYIE